MAAAAPNAIEWAARETAPLSAGTSGAEAYAHLDTAGDDAPSRELETGWGVAVVEQTSRGRERWARTSRGDWIAVRDLAPARPSSFHGEEVVGGALDISNTSALPVMQDALEFLDGMAEAIPDIFERRVPRLGGPSTPEVAQARPILS